MLERNVVEENRVSEMVVRINLEDALSRLRVCPVCGDELVLFPEYPMEPTCNKHGEFTITEVWTSGEVLFTFKMNMLDGSQGFYAEEGPTSGATLEQHPPQS